MIDDTLRIKTYQRLRGYMPCVIVKNVEHETHPRRAFFWIAEHKAKTGELPSGLKSVTWSAGPMFNESSSDKKEENFADSFSYYGPALFLATLNFDDGTQETAPIYAFWDVPEIIKKSLQADGGSQ